MNATYVAGLPETSPPPLWLGAAELLELLPAATVVAAVESALAAAGPRAATGHAALACDAGRGAFHVKATALGGALAGSRAIFVAKINANFPGNPAIGLPTIQGVVALFDAADGRLLALLDSPELTALRTGAATAVAARYLARSDARRLLLVGAGRQAFAQIAALATVLPLDWVSIHDLEPVRASRLAVRVAAELGLGSEVVARIDAVARASDVIVTCTTARSPVLGREQVAPGTFVAAVGSDHPSKHELEPALLAAARCFVDSAEQALACGEMHHAVAAGLVAAQAIAGRLDELVTGTVCGRRSPEEITVFDSTGIAIEDAATAWAAYEGWLARRAPGE